MALEDGMSLNGLVNQVLSKYVSFERAIAHESVVVPSQLFAEMAKAFPEEQAKSVGSKLGPKLRQDFAFHHINQDSEALLNSHFEQMGAFSGWYRLEASRSESHIRVAVMHEFGLTWSKFLIKYYQSAIQAVTGAEPQIEQEGDILVITF
ncbi:MAG: hypothetical protein ABSF83_15705 [Nitrososphaerales archaeon]|jgi:hypothetical protein